MGWTLAFLLEIRPLNGAFNELCGYHMEGGLCPQNLTTFEGGSKCLISVPESRAGLSSDQVAPCGVTLSQGGPSSTFHPPTEVLHASPSPGDPTFRGTLTVPSYFAIQTPPGPQIFIPRHPQRQVSTHASPKWRKRVRLPLQAYKYAGQRACVHLHMT